MKRETIAAVFVGAGAVVLFTALLFFGRLGEIAYTSLLTVSALASLSIAFNQRLKVLDLRNLKVVLRRIDQAKEDVKQLKKEVEEMYGNIDHLKNPQALKIDGEKADELGLDGDGFLIASGAMRYVSGCITRERQRLAQIFIHEKTPEQLSTSIMDGSLDDRVFQWAPPERTIDMAPKPGKEYRREREQARLQAEQSRPAGGTA